jgi:hypothetical protein
VRTPRSHFSCYSAILVSLICVVGLGILAAPSKSQPQVGAALPNVVRLFYGLQAHFGGSSRWIIELVDLLEVGDEVEVD